jgi:uncharacterized protein YjiS (DUF1127 family)
LKLAHAAKRPAAIAGLSMAVLSGAARISRRLWSALGTNWRVYRDERELLGQPDYRLRDIGITREEIAFRLRGKR